MHLLPSFFLFTPQLWRRHVLPSLALLNIVDSARNKDCAGGILDLGSGGGFPGIPLAIVRDDLSFTLMDARRGKMRRAKYLCEALDLRNVTCVHERAFPGKLHPNSKRHGLAVGRAVAPYPAFAEIASPRVARGGGVAYLGDGKHAPVRLVLSQVLGAPIYFTSLPTHGALHVTQDGACSRAVRGAPRSQVHL